MKEKINDYDVLSGKDWKFTIFGEEKTLKRTTFKVNRMMRELAVDEAKLTIMPMTSNKEIKAYDKAEAEVEKKLKEFIRMTVQPLSQDELDNIGIDDFKIVARQIKIRGQLADGWTYEQYIRSEQAEIELRVKAMEDGSIEDFLEKIEKIQKTQINQ